MHWWLGNYEDHCTFKSNTFMRKNSVIMKTTVSLKLKPCNKLHGKLCIINTMNKIGELKAFCQ